MKELEQRISDAVNEKLNDGTVEKLIEQHIEKAVSQASELSYKQGFTYYFGFRNLGVDHESFIQARLDATEIYGKVYRSLYRLHITVKGSEVQGTLVSLSLK